jgi:hypothetical protein
MSRTKKDRRWELRWPEEQWEYRYERVPVDLGTYTAYKYLPKPGVLTKKRRTYDDWHWIGSCPRWWRRLTMTRPLRRKGRVWEHKVLREDLEITDPPQFGRKPHIYFY